MEPSKLEAMILANDWSVLDHVGGMGQAAVPVLGQLILNPGKPVRLLTVLCLQEVKGPSAARLLAKAINDEEEQVRVYAADALRVAGDASIRPALETAVAGHQDPMVRAKTALALGIYGDANSLERLRKSLLVEKEPKVGAAVRQAMARLGDADAKKVIVGQLGSPDKKIQLQALEQIEYIGDKALVTNVSPLLNDTSPMMGLINAGDNQVVLRTNDAAAKTIAVVLKQPFSFKLTGYRVCTDAEIREVQTYLRREVPSK
jgi:HEAT repeat protein